MSVSDIFEKHNNDFIKFELIKNKRSTRPDLHAFLLLNELFPGYSDIVCFASYGKIWLDVSYENIEKLSEDQIIELIRCGVLYSSDESSLYMFA